MLQQTPLELQHTEKVKPYFIFDVNENNTHKTKNNCFMLYLLPKT